MKGEITKATARVEDMIDKNEFLNLSVNVAGLKG